MSNRFKNLVFDNKSNDEKDEPNKNVKYEEPKLKENSRWKREGDDANRFKTSNNKDGNRENYREGNRGENYREGSRGNYRVGGNREGNSVGNYRDGGNREGNSGRNYRDGGNRGGGNRGNYRGGNRNNFNRRYKGNYRKPTGPAPCAADTFGINFNNLERFDKTNEKMIEKKKKVVEKPKFVKMKKDEDDVQTEEEMKITLAMAQKYQYVTESEDEGEDEDDDAVSVDSMDDWKPQHL